MTGVTIMTLLLLSTHQALTGHVQLYHTEGTKKQFKVLDKTIYCDRTLLFEVKVCENACVMIKDKKSKEGIFVQISSGHSPSKLFVRTPSRGTKPTQKIIKLLDCNKFMSFWIHWDASGVAFGAGLAVGRNEQLRNSKTVDIIEAEVKIWTLKQYEGVWRIITDDPPMFLKPPPGSTTRLDVPEDTPPGKVLYHVEARDPDDRVTYDVIGDSREIFRMKGSGFTMQKDLDYETQKVYWVVVRAKGGDQEVNTTLLVNVTNVHDEHPVIHVATTQTVVEELPLGEVVPGVFTVSEKEAGGGLNYRLLGEHKKYIGVNTFTGDLLMVDRLDYENSSCPRVLDHLTLEVENVVGHKSRANLSIRVVNLNDNAPRFNETIYKAKVTEKDDIGQPLVTIRCEDPDREDINNLTLIVKEPDLSSVFRIQRIEAAFELSLKDNVTDIENLGSKVTLTLVARDSNTAIVHTATAQVLIDMSAISNFTPVWISPVGYNDSGIPEIFVQEDHPLHLPITIFNATSTGDIIYTIQSVVTDSNERTMDKFTIDEHFGNLKATSVLDCDLETGGVDFYTISVRASLLGAKDKYSVRQIRLYIDDIDDNAPIFDEGFYYVQSGCNKYEEVTLLTFNVTDYDMTSNTTFTMAENASKYAMLDSENGSIVLMPSPNGTIDRWETYEVLEVTAHDVSDARLNTTAYVMVYYENCSPGAQRKKKLRGKGAVFLPRPTKRCEVKQYVRDKTVEDYIFKATSGVLGLILVCIAAFYLSKKTVFKSTPSVNPLTEVQDEDDEDQKNSEGDRRSNVITVGPKRDEKPGHRSGSELTSITE